MWYDFDRGVTTVSGRITLATPVTNTTGMPDADLALAEMDNTTYNTHWNTTNGLNANYSGQGPTYSTFNGGTGKCADYVRSPHPHHQHLPLPDQQASDVPR